MADYNKQLLALSGNTLIPMSAVGLIFGVAYWTNNLATRIEVTEKRMQTYETTENKIDDVSSNVSEIKAHVAAIDARLELLIRMRKKGD